MNDIRKIYRCTECLRSIKNYGLCKNCNTFFKDADAGTPAANVTCQEVAGEMASQLTDNSMWLSILERACIQSAMGKEIEIHLMRAFLDELALDAANKLAASRENDKKDEFTTEIPF